MDDRIAGVFRPLGRRKIFDFAGMKIQSVMVLPFVFGNHALVESVGAKFDERSLRLMG